MALNALTQALRTPDAMGQYTLAQWDELIRLARVADLTARLSALVRRHGLWDRIPERPRRHLEAAELMCARQQVELGYEVKEIGLALAPLNVPVVLLKGAAYVRAGMAAGLGRMVGDVDILVPREVLPEAESNLFLRGWVSSSKDPYDQRYYREWMHELPPMTHMKRGTVLDVHHAILPTTARLHPSSAQLLAAARPIGDGSGLFCLQPVDMVLHSATHLMHEGEFEQGLRGLVDLDNLLAECGAQPDFWAQLVARAQALELARPLYYALRQASRQLNTPVPQVAMAKLEAVPGAQPGPLALRWMDAMFDRVLRVQHPMLDDRWSGLAREFMYLRGHWLRMPPGLLALHLARKGWLGLVKRPHADEPANDLPDDPMRPQ